MKTTVNCTARWVGFRRMFAIGALAAFQACSALAPAVAEATTSPTSAAPSTYIGKFKKVMVVVLENTSYEYARSQPFLSGLAQRGAILTHLTAETHPSQPNYIALIAGATFGVKSDANVDLKGDHLGGLLEAKGLDWRVYAENYPGNCYLGGRKGTYVRKHVPFLSFENVQQNSDRCARIVDATQLQADVESGSLPAFALYIPDLDDDGHDTSVVFADSWMSKKFGPLLEDPRFNRDLLLIVTFDEGKRVWSLPFSNTVLTILIGSSVVPGSTSDLPYTHYSLLRLIEDGLGLGNLSQNDTTATPVTGIWK